MAEDVTLDSLSQPLVRTRRDRARQTSYRFRFGILYAVLAAIVGAGVGAFIVLATRPAPPEAAAWSSWEPSGSRVARMRQIADRIPKAYTAGERRAADGEPGKPARRADRGEATCPSRRSSSVPTPRAASRRRSDIDAYSGADVVSYGLCGLGTSAQCAITEGTPSTERFTLLQRQALELSLYTFKYVDDVDSVLVFMPPTPSGESNGTIFLRRDDVADELRRPLSHLLALTRAARRSASARSSWDNILRLTQPRTYAVQFQAASDGRPIVVLTPPTAGS